MSDDKNNSAYYYYLIQDFYAKNDESLFKIINEALQMHRKYGADAYLRSNQKVSVIVKIESVNE